MLSFFQFSLMRFKRAIQLLCTSIGARVAMSRANNPEDKRPKREIDRLRESAGSMNINVPVNVFHLSCQRSAFQEKATGRKSFNEAFFELTAES